MATKSRKKVECPALVTTGAIVRASPSTTGSVAWRVERQMGEGTFSRIYDLTPLPPTNSNSPPLPSFPCVLKVNKFPPPQSDPTNSFTGEYAVWCDVQTKQRQTQQVSGKRLHIPQALEYQPICTPDYSQCTRSESPRPIEYLVLERCGVDWSALRDYWQSQNDGQGEPLAALQFGKLALQALEEFHAAGYVHRDIKPSNFLTVRPTESDVYSRVLVTDFGLSRTVAELASEPVNAPVHCTVGKSLYSSFTSHQCKPQTPRDDVVSLMFVILDCMYGQLPWKQLSNTNMKTDGTKKTPAERWNDVYKMKNRLIGEYISGQAAQEADRKYHAEYPWLTDPVSDKVTHHLPFQMRMIFHQLHTSGSQLEYGELQLSLDKLIAELPERDDETGQEYRSLQQILDSYNAQVLGAEDALRKQQEEYDRQVEEHRQKKLAREKQRAQEVEEYQKAKAAAKLAKQQAAAAAAAAKPPPTIPTPPPPVPAVKSLPLPPPPRPTLPITPAAARPQQPSSVSTLLNGATRLSAPPVSVPSNLPIQPKPKPKPYNTLPILVRVLLGRCLHLNWQFQHAIQDQTGVNITIKDPLSLDVQWAELDWNYASISAQKQQKVGSKQLILDEWRDGDWNILFQGLASLEQTQLESLIAYLSASPNIFPVPTKPMPTLLKMAVPVNIAFIYQTIKKARMGNPRLDGFTAAIRPPTTVSKPAGPATPVKSAAPPSKPSVVPGGFKIPKKAKPVVDSDVNDLTEDLTKSVKVKTDIAVVKPEKGPEKKSIDATKPIDKKKVKTELKKEQPQSKGKYKRIRVSSSSSSSSGSDSDSDSSSSSSSSSSSDDDDQLVVTIKSKAIKNPAKPQPSASVNKVSPKKIKEKGKPPKSTIEIDSDDDLLPEPPRRLPILKQPTLPTFAPAFRKKAMSDDEPDSSDEEVEESPPTPATESQYLEDEEEATIESLGPENSRTREVKQLAKEKEKFIREDTMRRLKAQKLKAVQLAAKREEKRQAQQAEEERSYNIMCEQLIHRFGSGSMMSSDSMKAPIHFDLPKRFLMTPQECRAEDKRIQAELNVDRYENLNKDLEFVRQTDIWLNGVLAREHQKKVAEEAIKKAEEKKLKAAQQMEIKAEKARLKAIADEEKARLKALAEAEKQAAKEAGIKKKRKTIEEELAINMSDPNELLKAALQPSPAPSISPTPTTSTSSLTVVTSSTAQLVTSTTAVVKTESTILNAVTPIVTPETAVKLESELAVKLDSQSTSVSASSTIATPCLSVSEPPPVKDEDPTPEGFRPSGRLEVTITKKENSAGMVPSTLDASATGGILPPSRIPSSASSTVTIPIPSSKKRTQTTLEPAPTSATTPAPIAITADSNESQPSKKMKLEHASIPIEQTTPTTSTNSTNSTSSPSIVSSPISPLTSPPVKLNRKRSLPEEKDPNATDGTADGGASKKERKQ